MSGLVRFPFLGCVAAYLVRHSAHFPHFATTGLRSSNPAATQTPPAQVRRVVTPAPQAVLVQQCLIPALRIGSTGP